MKLKSLLFGSAAVIAAGTGAQAADLPIVEPVEYVRICDAFGAGFYYIPGTDTCLKVSGRVRAESHFVNVDDDPSAEFFFGNIAGVPNDEEQVNTWTTRARGNIRLDARTQTEFGLVRAFIDFEMTVGPGATTGEFGDENYNGTAVALAAAFIQISNDWGTYTAGHSGSFFDFFGSHGYGSRIDIDDNTTEQTLFGWTFAGGNGFSFTIAAEDPASSGRRKNGVTTGNFALGDEDYEGQEFPDGVANIRIDQGWGSAQIMGVVHHVHDEDDGGADVDDLGWAAGAGATIGIPGGWEISAQGGYSVGAIGYLTNDPGGIGDINDDGDLNEAWMVRGGITGPIFTNVTVWLDGSFTHVEEPDGASEYDFWAAKAGGYWEPVPGLQMGPEVAYNNVQMEDDDLPGDDEEVDVWGVMWRIARSF
jgi:hypothetical protein